MNVKTFTAFLFLSLPSMALAHYSEPMEESFISDEAVTAIVRKYFNNSTLKTPGDNSERVFRDSTVVSSVSLGSDSSMTLFIDRAFNPGAAPFFRAELGRLPFAVKCTTKDKFYILEFIDKTNEANERSVSIVGDGIRIFRGEDLRRYSALCKIHPVLVSLLEKSLSI
ncbi:MAG: hypothetical protein CMF12_08895 [Idiomarina sp.]|uniref:hypothetical protein n=1 Tax=Idiomarina sp. TaxID=1874361 RepID=UPI000C434F86|nr:hypothetical protein [Idiomarina sp.]MBT42628.1 hypothetical protein [Idiomarina sp.]|tara:strand:- start:71 stop:574 length:504 start_codon:yes stop_codon:yes gene_type:complete